MDVEFDNFLTDYWNNQLDSFPLYSSSLGFSKYDRKISSNSIRAHNELLEISKKDLNKLFIREGYTKDNKEIFNTMYFDRNKFINDYKNNHN